MRKKSLYQSMPLIERTSYLWQTLLAKIRLPKKGVVIEVASGYEPKIGNALLLRGFQGTIFLIDPDREAIRQIKKIYQRILPKAKVIAVNKRLQDVAVGPDIPSAADAVMASHPFDDMVMASIAGKIGLFSQEKNSGTDMPPSLKKWYAAIKEKDYIHGIEKTTAVWKRFIEEAEPRYFIASQYPSRTLTIKGLTRRQNSGFMVMERLKKIYRKFLIEYHLERLYGLKGNPKWWLIVKNPRAESDNNAEPQPLAMHRLGKSIFVAQPARRLRPEEYDVIYADKQYFGNLNAKAHQQKIRSLALVLDNKKSVSQKIITYADLQKDKTNIGLSGNLGSGRAIYYGRHFNILGVGKTTLCRSSKPSHSTGWLELVGAMRRIVLAKWTNYFIKRAVEQPALIGLKKSAEFKWSSRPIPLCLLVRVDDGDLDRPSHIEQCPKIPVNFQRVLTEYSKLDAEYFTYRLMLGAWSTSNYSLNGRVIDLESASFTKYRGPYYTSSPDYPHTRFGYEGLGFLNILRQLADSLGFKKQEVENNFYAERQRWLGHCFLALLGVRPDSINAFFAKYQNCVIALANQFEKLAKKISSPQINLNLYTAIPDDRDPSLLDMSNLFRNLDSICRYSADKETDAFRLLVRKTALAQIRPNFAGNALPVSAVVSQGQLAEFLKETRKFIRDLFRLINWLDSEKCLGKKSEWQRRLRARNQDLPAMSELNEILKDLAESYRIGKISPEFLGKEISKLADLPNR